MAGVLAINGQILIGEYLIFTTFNALVYLVKFKIAYILLMSINL